MKKTVLALLCLLISTHLFAQEAGGQLSYKATRTASPPTVDGVLADECWEATGEWSGRFVQQQPVEGAAETEETYLKILYDDHYIYVAFRALDREPEKINRWAAPRDEIKGDCVAIIFDSYADKRTGFAFAVTAGGTRADFLCENTSNDDYTWNAVWEGRASADAHGWYAEMRIPLSQLRYSNKAKEQEWGFHAIRLIDRKKEYDHLNLIPQNNKGLVFSFGTLTGIADLPRSRRVELSPYTSLKLETSPREAGNPYATGSRWAGGFGLDGKVGITSDFTLDFTVNPDFGQVEADPSTINLSAFETYYEEKRPFFLEGKNIFNMLGESLFYSRRIGARPQWSPEDEEGRYASVPKQTHILTAVKLSGKSKSGLSLGILNSLTAKESAKITENGSEYSQEAQPLTSYSVARVQQDFRQGNTIVGGLLTSVNRRIREPHLEFLPRNAYTGAVDFSQYFRNREYYVLGTVQYSHVEGSREAITRLQGSPVHNYQREGATYVSMDSARTSLSGSAGTILIGRGGGKKVVSEHRFTWASPGFEVNDLGYLQKADYKMTRGYVAYIENTQRGLVRSYQATGFYNFHWDYGGTSTFGRFGIEGNMTFDNQWGFYACGFYDTPPVENGMLRGGPSVKINPRWGTDFNAWTNKSKKFWAETYYGTMLGEERFGQFANLRLNYRPLPNLGLMLRFAYDYLDKGLEYVAKPEMESGKRAYVMSAIKQDIFGITLRLDYSITPDLSVQFYGNPFFSSGKYTEFKRATDTMNDVYDNRFRLLDDGQTISYDKDENVYNVREANGDRYSFDNPDFSFREFRFNMVARWEYRPNSTIYLVWGQDRSGVSSDYTSSFQQNAKEMMRYSPSNVFMIKLNYWFSL